MSTNSSRPVSRRTLLTSLAAFGASGLAGAAPAAQIAGAEKPFSLSSADRQQAASALLAYFSAIAPRLLRQPEGLLRHPSLAISLPGKEYSTSVWDWDTLWVSRALLGLAKHLGDSTLRAQLAAHARGTLFNFFDHQSQEGRLPIVMTATNVDPFGCLKKAVPNIQNQAKPVMAQLALLLCDDTSDAEWFRPYFDRLLHFFDSWTLGNLTPLGLLVWGDDVAIGNDNDPTTFGRPFFSSANLLLNCLFYQDLRAAATIADRLHRPEDHLRLDAQATELAKQISNVTWDTRDTFFYTADVQCVDRRAELIPGSKRGMAMSWQSLPLRIGVFTGFLPLWCGIASQKQASELIERHYLADNRFRCAAGVRSLSLMETMYSLEFSSNPSNWLGPVWIIVNYFVWKALKNYGFSAAADELGDKTINLLAQDLKTNGSLNEYYHPDTGAPLSHTGFLDWNMLVIEMIADPSNHGKNAP